MKKYFAADALLPSGWARDVVITVDDAGNFSGIASSRKRNGEEALKGPVLPGMANLHSHAFQRAMAGLAEVQGDPQDDFWTWRELMYRFVARLTPEQAQAVARQLYVEMLLNGYTAVAEFHYVHNAADGIPYAAPAEMLSRHLEAARETGIAITLLPSLYRWGHFGERPLAPRQQRFASRPEDVLSMLEKLKGATNADTVVGVSPHSLRAVDPSALKELVAGLEARAPVHIHAAEQTREVEECVAATGRRPVEWLLEHMALNERWCVVHATHMTPEETRGLAASGAVAGLCPTTEGNLGDGVFPLTAYRAAGGAYGIGGDSHVSRDPAEELRTLEYVQRLTQRRRNLVVGTTSAAVGTTLWLEAAAGGARALGRRMGALAPGHRADLLVLDASHPDLATRSGDALANSLVFSGSRGLVRDVMVAGAWRVRDGRHPLAERAAAGYRSALGRLLAD